MHDFLLHVYIISDHCLWQINNFLHHLTLQNHNPCNPLPLKFIHIFHTLLSFSAIIWWFLCRALTSTFHSSCWHCVQTTFEGGMSLLTIRVFPHFVSDINTLLICFPVRVFVIYTAEHLILGINVWTTNIVDFIFHDECLSRAIHFLNLPSTPCRGDGGIQRKSYSQHRSCGQFLDPKVDLWSRTNIIKEGFTW